MISLRDIFEDSPWEADEFPFYRGIQFGFLGIILFYFSYHIAARHVQFSSLSPVLQLLIAHLPFIVCGTGGALLGFVELAGIWWRKVLDMPAALPCSKRIFCRELLKWSLLLVVAATLLNLIFSFFLRNLGFQHFPKQSLEAFGADAGLPFWIIAFILSVIIVPVSEEILFRRVLYHGLKSLGFSHAGLVTAILFSLCHTLPQALLSFVFFSLVLQKASQQLVDGTGSDAGYNLIVFILMIGKYF